MSINFDLISDLNLESMDNFSWEGKATSLFCIVAGNISSDHDVLLEFLEHTTQFYEAVFFIDGELEHKNYNGDFDASYDSLKEIAEIVDKAIFLHENIIVLNGATLLATNGWTTFDFTNQHTLDDTIDILASTGEQSEYISNEIFKMAMSDQHYLRNSIRTCQTMPEVQNLIIITSSVPRYELISHDFDYSGTLLGDTIGNNGVTSCLKADTEDKVAAWLFGRYPGDLDFNYSGVRYVNNPGNFKDQSIYYPKIIKP